MARFSCDGMDGFVISMEEMARLDDDAVDSILMAGAEVVRKAHVDAISQTFDQHTAKLIGSPHIHLKIGGGRNGHAARERYALIYPEGEHHTYHAVKGDGIARNADLGFVHEFGGHGNRATNWMFNANLQCSGAMAEAEEKAYDAWLTKHNL